MDGQADERTRNFQRFLTFVDAIVAIAITLLVLPLVDLSTGLHNGSVAGMLSDHSDEILGFLLSFLVIASLWSAQHQVMEHVVAATPLVTRLLLAWTLTIVVLPFPTALVAEAGDQSVTKIFYIGTMAISSALLALLCWAIGKRHSIRDSDTGPDILPSTLTTVAFLVALAVSLIFPATSYFPLLLLLLIDPLLTLRRRTKGGARGRQPSSRR